MSNPASSLYGGVAMVRNVRSSPPASMATNSAFPSSSYQGRPHTSTLSLKGSDHLVEEFWNAGSSSSSPPSSSHHNNSTLRPSQLARNAQSPVTLHTTANDASPDSQGGELQFESEYLKSLFRNERTQLSPESAAVLGLGPSNFMGHGQQKSLAQDGQEHNTIRGSPIGYSVLSGRSIMPDSGTPPLRRVSSLQTDSSGSGERWKKGARSMRPYKDNGDKENMRPEPQEIHALQVQTPSFRPQLHPRTLSKEFIKPEMTAASHLKKDAGQAENVDAVPTPVNQKTLTSANATVQRSATTARWRRVGRLGLGPAKRSRPEDEPVQESEGELASEGIIEEPIEGHHSRAYTGSSSLPPEEEIDNEVEQGRRYPQQPVVTEPLSSQTRHEEEYPPSVRWRGLNSASKASPSEISSKTAIEHNNPPPSSYVNRSHSRQASQEWTTRPASQPDFAPVPIMPATVAVERPASRNVQQLQTDLAQLDIGPRLPTPAQPPTFARSEVDEASLRREIGQAIPAVPPIPDLLPAPILNPTSAAALPIPSQPPPPLPTKSGKGNVLVNGRAFTRLDVIGRGGSSKVYKVMAPNNRIFALKKVSFDKADQSAVAGYINEIGLLKRLTGNDRIIRLYDAEVSHEKGFLLMLMECGEIDLAHLLQKQAGKAINLNFIRMYWEQMLQAVHAIHEERIVHSDLKPANFLLVEGSLKLIDFGIAKAISNDTTNIHRDQQVGTVNYMSPEAINDTNVGMPGATGKRLMKLGRPSDVWSLGCILYQMVFGRPPFAALSMYQKIQVIPDANYKINFPAKARPVVPSAGANGSVVIPTDEELDRLAVDVEADLLRTMKSCLERDGKMRMTIPELLQDPFLKPGRRDSMNRSTDTNQVSLDPDGFAAIVGQVLAFAKARRHEMISKEDAEILSKTLYARLKE